MRTTVTLDSDTEALVKRCMAERKVSFKQAINHAIRAGLAGPSASGPAFRTRTVAMGSPAVSLDRALQLVAELEDEELVRKGLAENNLGGDEDIRPGGRLEERLRRPGCSLTGPKTDLGK